MLHLDLRPGPICESVLRVFSFVSHEHRSSHMIFALLKVTPGLNGASAISTPRAALTRKDLGDGPWEDDPQLFQTGRSAAAPGDRTRVPTATALLVSLFTTALNYMNVALLPPRAWEMAPH
jgi:hypothetical protein